MVTRLILPYPPTGNHAYKHTRLGQHYMTQEARQYQATVYWEVRRQQPSRPQFTGSIAVVYVIRPPDNRKRDIANTEKVMTDAIAKAGLIGDDSMIDAMLLWRETVTKGGAVLALIGFADEMDDLINQATMEDKNFSFPSM